MNKTEKVELNSVGKVKAILIDWRGFVKTNRSQYKTDTKALLCKGLEEDEQNAI